MLSRLDDIKKLRVEAAVAPSEDCISCGKPGGWVQLPKKPGLYHVTCAFLAENPQGKQRKRILRLARAMVKAVGRD